MLSLQIGKKTFDDLELREAVNEGKYFKHNDFVLQNYNIPVILGFNYKKNYNIGDKFNFYYMEDKKFTGKVMGFLDKGAEIVIDEVYNLNDYILMPSLNKSNNSLRNYSASFLNKLYLSKIEGKIRYLTKHQYYEAVNYIEQISSSSKIGLTYIEDLHVFPEDYTSPFSNSIIIIC